MTMGDLEFHNPLTNLVTLKTQIPIQGLPSTHGVITKDFFKTFYVSQKRVSRGNDKS
jgi:hypothetical protein